MMWSNSSEAVFEDTYLVNLNQTCNHLIHIKWLLEESPKMLYPGQFYICNFFGWVLVVLMTLKKKAMLTKSALNNTP